MDISKRYHTLNTQSYPWFDAQWHRVIGLYNSDKLPHALIINGVKGIGKLHFASAIAQFVLGSNQQSLAPCQQCRSCQLFA